MAKVAGFESLDALIDATVPSAIRRTDGMPLGRFSEGLTESEFLAHFKDVASKNKVGGWVVLVSLCAMLISSMLFPILVHVCMDGRRWQPCVGCGSLARPWPIQGHGEREQGVVCGWCWRWRRPPAARSHPHRRGCPLGLISALAIY